MPPAASTDELLDRVRRSGLIPPAELDAALVTLPPGAPPLPHLLADRLLTPFQADRLAAGKYKGFVLGGYVILDKLGAGGMGQVFLAEHTTMRRLVAVKVLSTPAQEDAVAFERFVREARAAAAVNHPNIVRVFDLNRDGRLHYLVMEFVDGLTLGTLVEKSGPVAVGAAAGYARQVALGLQHAFDRGLVHRDVKPSNVMVDRHGTARLLDLGLVRFESESDSKLTSQAGGGTILGTADFLAPEQAVDSSSVDIRADIYGLGATLYFLLAGHPLFPTGKTAQKLMWQQWREPTPVGELRPGVPAGLAGVVHRALAKRPADRWPTPQALADALEPFAEPAAPSPELVPVPPLRKWTKLTSDPGLSGSRLLLPPGPGPRPGSSQVVELPPVRPAAGATVGRAADQTTTAPPPAEATGPGFWAGLAVGAGALLLAGLAVGLALGLR